MDIVMLHQFRAAKINRLMVLGISLLLVSGQLSAYPLMCAMPDMEMGELVSGSGIANPMHVTEHSMPSGHAMDFKSDSMHEMSNCAQICGYCIGQNLPVRYEAGLLAEFRGTDNLDLFIPPVPTGYYRDLFRPPISV